MCTIDLAGSIAFYTEKLGFTLEFQYEDFYAGVKCGVHTIHVKLVDEPDPSIAFVDRDEHFHLYLETNDIEAVDLSGLCRSGVAPYSIGGGVTLAVRVTAHGF